MSGLTDTAGRLRRWAELRAQVRAFFAARGVLEVDTPLLGNGVVVEAAIDPIPCQVRVGPGGVVERHLLSSPEGPMKRLLATGSGPIYQFAHAFRDGEVGRRHAIEFTMLEWYRPGFDHHQLMDEVEELVAELLPSLAPVPFERSTYRQLFLEGVGLDPFATTVKEVCAACERVGVPAPESLAGATEPGALDEALDILLVGHLEPRLGCGKPTFVSDYPASQAALARLDTDASGHEVARRFELYIEGVELANGYHELVHAAEQRQRFKRANQERQARCKPALPVDEALLRALEGGLPDCAGVALGFDRLVMLAMGVRDLCEVTALPVDGRMGGDGDSGRRSDPS